MAVRIGCIYLVTVFQCGLQATAHQRNGRTNMPPHRNNRVPGTQVHTSFEPVEALLFDEIETELPEAETCSIVAEATADDQIHEGIGVARPIAVAMLGTQVGHPQQDEAPQIRVKHVSWG